MLMPNMLPMFLPALLPPLAKPKRLAEQIREAYPNPQRLNEFSWTEDSYCVFIAAHRVDPAATNAISGYMACRIFEANDMGDLERAWTLLDEALEEK